MAVKTRKSAAAKATASSPEHLHPSSAAQAKPSSATTAPSSSSSTASTIGANGHNGTHVPLKTPHRDAYAAANAFTWNPIKLIERQLFRAYWNIEATFVLSMLEAWEVFLVIVVFLTLTLLLWYSLYHYFPRHAQQVATRALYYVYGNSPPPQLAKAVTAEVTNASASAAAAAQTATDGMLEKLIASSNQLWAKLGQETAEESPEVVDRLIANLNKVKQMMGTSGKVEL